MTKLIMKNKPNYDYLEKYGIISIVEDNGTYTIILENKPF